MKIILRDSVSSWWAVNGYEKTITRETVIAAVVAVAVHRHSVSSPFADANAFNNSLRPAVTAFPADAAYFLAI